MYEFRTLGMIELRDDSTAPVPEPLRHTKRVALLAYLAAPFPTRPHRRETLIALLWPDLDESHGRGMLRHELYALRRELGPDLFHSDGRETIGVNGDRLWCDAGAFDELITAGQLIEALDLVHGEFLPGLGVNGDTFDRWLDGERSRLGRRAATAADRLSQAMATSGDLPGAAHWARRWTELAPYDEGAWRRLVSLLDRTGDRAEALATFERLAARFREDLQIDPSPVTRKLVESIRSRPAGESDGEPAEGDASDLLRPAVVIAVRPVENLSGDPGHDGLARRLTDRLAGGISELSYVEAVVGHEIRWATAVVSATLYAKNDRLLARTRLTEPKVGGRVLAVPEPVLLDPNPEDEELAEVVARVLASVAVYYDPRQPIGFIRGRPVRTPSWEAWLELIRGSEAFGQFQFEEAARRLRRANQIDPTFVKVGIFAAIAQAYCGDPEGAEKLAREAYRRGEETASDYERHFAAWFLANLRGRRPEAYRAGVELRGLTTHPVWCFLAGREAYRMNRPLEALGLLEGGEVGQGWWRNWAEGCEVAGGALHLLGSHHAELDVVLRWRSRLPEALEPMRAEARTRAALGEPRAALEVVDQAMTLPSRLVTPGDVAWTAAQELDVHGYLDEGTMARQKGLDWAAHRSEPPRADRLLAARLLFESGKLEQAAERLRELEPFDDLELLGLAGLLAAVSGDVEAARGVIAALEGLQNPYLSGQHLLHAAGIHAALADRTEALETLRRALAAGLPFGVELHALPLLRPLIGHAEFEQLLRPRDVPEVQPGMDSGSASHEAQLALMR